ncbi:hypothetical protein AsGV051 [Agrotis segetum granulovirus]|uniref:Uncharacterized protein n=1 Tax=Agrotis segetum granulosis virus TaxID=10464 RepID=A0A023MI71_GVAS|nr:hypothetical protein AsGV051 [Agrotis segetum granulovirus]AHN92090.1 hypothetical protein AsGV051 [Agrotis segetum granulovirus]AKN63325.1 hypothetical protein AsGV051 [Agrotis segetum granulovirus]
MSTSSLLEEIIIFLESDEPIEEFHQTLKRKREETNEISEVLYKKMKKEREEKQKVNLNRKKKVKVEPLEYECDDLNLYYLRKCLEEENEM